MSQASLAALPPALRPTDDDWTKMLAAHIHLGTKNLDNNMVRALKTPHPNPFPPTPSNTRGVCWAPTGGGNRFLPQGET